MVIYVRKMVVHIEDAEDKNKWKYKTRVTDPK